jgi:hypothetical protein
MSTRPYLHGPYRAARHGGLVRTITQETLLAVVGIGIVSFLMVAMMLR